MKRPPSFPFFTDDWLGSDTVEGMSLAEQGAFIRLLARAWNSPDKDCGLPDDDAVLANRSWLGEAWHGESGEKLKRKFPVAPNGRRYNAKLLGEWKRCEDYAAVRAKAADVMWEKRRRGEI